MQLTWLLWASAGLWVGTATPTSHRTSSHTEQSARPKRQAFLPYFPYQPLFPQVYQVHNIVLTPPGFKCTPLGHDSGRRPPVTPRPPAVPTTPGTTDGDDDLGFRMGNDTAPSSRQPPSKCVWSIVACCAPGSRNIRYACFELLGCPGAFWDLNPCDERVVTAAANSALQFYMNNQSPTAEPSFQNL